MFESQDMLPRFPPMPSAPANEAAIKPTVPEVSIILGKETPNEAKESQPTPLSYADWKKLNLPRVTFPPNLNDEESLIPPVQSSNLVTTRSNVFPMRTVIVPTSTSTGAYTTASLTSSRVTDKFYLHEPDRPIQTMPNSLSQFTYRSEQRRSTDSLSQKSQVSEATLTICASTQTDTVRDLGSSGEFFKIEFSHLMDIIKELQNEQRKIREMMQTFMAQQQKGQTRQIFYCDQATQCEFNIMSGTDTRSASLENVPPYNHDNVTLHHELPNVKIYSPIIRETVRPAVPVAQSTTYRMNTPTNTKQNGPLMAQPNNQYLKSVPSLPKPTTERSLVMNELALKYLPSDKLTELLQDAQITTGTVSTKLPIPLQETDNLNRAPTDISNASYKYLRKYRLLPDQNDNSNNKKELHSSPYQQQLQDSPKPYVNGSSGTETESPHIDLEHIRRQPKFL